MTDNETSSLPPAIFIMGPTGSGKTDLAMRLLEQFPSEIISVDSAQVYRDMNIGTAKPDDETLQKAPHRLIDIRDPSESYSAADFRRDALTHMDEITRAGNIPVLAGGTMLYFRALQYGLADMPNANPKIRAKIEAEAEEHGWQALHDRLRAIDPTSADRIHPNDPQRLQRALEVYEVCGKTVTELYAAAAEEEFPYRVLKIALVPSDRELLRERLTQRFDLMLEQGFMDEVKTLYQREDLHTNLPSIRCVGYRQAWDHLNGNTDFNLMRKRAIVATHQLAKRQLTWLRSERDTIIIDPLGDIELSVVELIRNFLTK